MSTDDRSLKADALEDDFENELHRQERRRGKLILGLAVLLALGSVLVALPIVLGSVRGGLLVLTAVACAGLAIAALVLALGTRLAGAGGRVGDLLNQLTPRIIGGRKPEQLDQHRRRRRGMR